MPWRRRKRKSPEAVADRRPDRRRRSPIQNQPPAKDKRRRSPRRGPGSPQQQQLPPPSSVERFHAPQPSIKPRSPDKFQFPQSSIIQPPKPKVSIIPPRTQRAAPQPATTPQSATFPRPVKKLPTILPPPSVPERPPVPQPPPLRPLIRPSLVHPLATPKSVQQPYIVPSADPFANQPQPMQQQPYIITQPEYHRPPAPQQQPLAHPLQKSQPPQQSRPAISASKSGPVVVTGAYEVLGKNLDRQLTAESPVLYKSQHAYSNVVDNLLPMSRPKGPTAPSAKPHPLASLDSVAPVVKTITHDFGTTDSLPPPSYRSDLKACPATSKRGDDSRRGNGNKRGQGCMDECKDCVMRHPTLCLLMAIIVAFAVILAITGTIVGVLVKATDSAQSPADPAKTR